MVEITSTDKPYFSPERHTNVGEKDRNIAAVKIARHKSAALMDESILSICCFERERLLARATST